MALKDLLSRGMDFINNSAEKIKNTAEEKRQALNNFENLIKTSIPLDGLKNYEVHNQFSQDGRRKMIRDVCLQLNVEKSKLIDSLIPIYETILDIKLTKEALTSVEYLFILTDKQLWIANNKEYVTYELGTYSNFEIVNTGLMSQGVRFDNRAFVFEGSEADIKKFISEVADREVREELTRKYTAYLCGVTPKVQYINTLFRGLTIGTNGEVVLHNETENNIIDPSKIEKVQLMIDDAVVISRVKKEKGAFTSNPMEAKKISVKVVADREYLIEVLPPSMMNKSYRREESVYIDNYDFAKMLVDKLTEFMQN